MKIDIRTLNERLDRNERIFVERRLRFALAKFGDSVSRAIVRVEDLNGPRGGLDKRCHIEVRMRGRGVLVVEVRDVELGPAVARAAERMARRVRDELTTRRTLRHRGAAADRRSVA